MDTRRKWLDETEEDEVDLPAVFKALFRCIPVMLVAALLFGAFAFRYTKATQAPVYTASFSVYTDWDTDIYIEVINGSEVLTTAAERAGLDYEIGKIRGLVSVDVGDDARVLKISAGGSSPEEALALAQGVESAAIDIIPQKIDNSNFDIIDEPTLPAGASSPSYAGSALKGAILGAGLVAVLAIFKELFYAQIHGKKQLEENFGAVVLGEVPCAARAKNEKPLCNSSSAKKTAYEELFDHLSYSLPGRGTKVIAVSSAASCAEKSAVAVNLASVIAQSGKTALIVDCAMSAPEADKLLSIGCEKGLSDILTGSGGFEDCVSRTEYGMDFLAAGKTSQEPSWLLESDEMTGLLAMLKGRYEYIVLDYPPVENMADFSVISKSIDGFLLVVRHRRELVRKLTRALKRLDLAHSRVLGFVYTRALRGRKIR